MAEGAARGPAVLRRAVDARTAFLGSVVAVDTADPHVVWTSDDGPDPRGTAAVLAALAAHRASATFFVLLTRVRRYGSLLAEVLDAGHEIGLHGVDHQPLPTFGYVEARRRTLAGRQELEDRTGRPVRWYRPPYGRQTLRSWRAVRACGLLPVMWGPTTWDWREVSQSERVAKAQQGVRRGAIVLAHDGFAGPADGAVPQRAPELDRGDLVARVLDAYRDRGLVARSLGDALTTGTAVRAARFRR